MEHNVHVWEDIPSYPPPPFSYPEKPSLTLAIASLPISMFRVEKKVVHMEGKIRLHRNWAKSWANGWFFCWMDRQLWTKGETSISSLSTQHTLFTGVETGPPINSVPMELLSASRHVHLGTLGDLRRTTLPKSVCCSMTHSFISHTVSHHIFFIIISISPHWEQFFFYIIVKKLSQFLAWGQWTSRFKTHMRREY